MVHHLNFLGSILARRHFRSAHMPIQSTNNVRVLPGTHLYTCVEIKCLAEGPKCQALTGIEPATLWSRVKGSIQSIYHSTSQRCWSVPDSAHASSQDTWKPNGYYPDDNPALQQFIPWIQNQASDRQKLTVWIWFHLFMYLFSYIYLFIYLFICLFIIYVFMYLCIYLFVFTYLLIHIFSYVPYD